MNKKDKRGVKADIAGKPNTKLIHAKISEADDKRIEELADYLQIPKMTLIRNLLLSGLDDAETLKKTGILAVAKGVKKTSEFLNQFKTIKESKSIKNN